VKLDGTFFCDIAEEVARLKEQPGKDLTVGGAGLASTFIELGLIDEYRLFVSPVVLGGGRSCWAAARITSLPSKRGSTWSWSRRRRLALASSTFTTDACKRGLSNTPRREILRGLCRRRTWLSWNASISSS
jgi:dihydrofolate reductase